MDISKDNNSNVKHLKDTIQAGIVDLETGKVHDDNTVITRLRKRLFEQGFEENSSKSDR